MRTHGNALAVLGGLVLLALIGCGGSGTGSSTSSNTMAFVSTRDSGLMQVFTMGTDGSNPTQITFGPSQNLCPDIRKDGQKIVWRAEGGPVAGVFMANMDGSGATLISGGTDDYPAFSPDGTKLTVTSYRDDSPEVYIMNADGTNQVRLTNDPGYDWYSSFSPDGQQITFASNRTGASQIYVMNIDGSNVRQVTTDGGIMSRFSPDGTKIAYSTKPASGDIWLINVDGTNPVQLTNTPDAGDESPYFSPDGTQIAFASDRSGSFQIYTMNVDGSNVQRITNNTASDTEPIWGP